MTIVIYGLHYLPPSKHSFLLGATLFLPITLLLNFSFALYWLLKVDRKFLMSMLMLLLAISWVKCFIVFNKPKVDVKDNTTTLKIASYNAHYLWRKGENRNKYFESEFKKQFLEKQPLDVLLLQEGATVGHGDSIKKEFLYSSTLNGRNSIYSNYPIINVRKIEWGGEKNRSVFYDLLVDKDTLRVYNVHLSSYKYPKSSDGLVKKGTKKLFRRLGQVFKTHEEQINLVANHIKNSPYPVIVSGDFNSLSNSYPYEQLTKLGIKDTFVEAGNGLGATYEFSYFPLRIDYIFVPETTKVLSHRVVKTKEWSDHYPIIAEIKL